MGVVLTPVVHLYPYDVVAFMSLQFLETTLFQHSLFREAGGSYKRNSSLIDIALVLPVSGTAEIRTRTPFRMEGLANLSDDHYSTIPFWGMNFGRQLSALVYFTVIPTRDQ